MHARLEKRLDDFTSLTILLLMSLAFLSAQTIAAEERSESSRQSGLASEGPELAIHADFSIRHDGE